jgi:hypothetical protein
VRRPGPHLVRLLALLLALLSIVSCGGGGSSSPPPPPPALAVVTQPGLPRGVVGVVYSGKLQATGGVPPYRWSTAQLGISGLALASDGTISGTPTGPGTFIPNFTVTDSAGATVTAGVEVDIVAPLAFATAGALPDANVALPVWVNLQVNGGAPPYTFSLAAGAALPAALTLSSSGLIQGTPTTPGSYNFTVQVTDTFTPPFKR